MNKQEAKYLGQFVIVEAIRDVLLAHAIGKSDEWSRAKAVQLYEKVCSDIKQHHMKGTPAMKSLDRLR